MDKRKAMNKEIYNVVTNMKIGEVVKAYKKARKCNNSEIVRQEKY